VVIKELKMKHNEARAKAREIRNTYAQGDTEGSHCMEDDLMREALKMVCNEEEGYLLVAKITLEVVSERRDRYCS
jgi:hypothetical protein